jgi:endonuclease/exonuclease/phosphatase family metal-dependent hydrolase
MFLQTNPFYHYDSVNDRWQEVKWYECEQELETFTDSRATIRVATFNVLFDQNEEDEPVVKSAERYIYQMTELLPSLDCDVLILQEVTTVYLGKLLKQTWVTDRYHYCSAFSKWTEKNPNFARRRSSTRNVILSRLPIRQLHTLHIGIEDHYANTLVATVSTPATAFTVVAVHLKASQQFVHVRKEQLDDLFQFFKVTERKHAFFSGEQPTERIAKAIRDENNKIQFPKSNPMNTTCKDFHNVVLAGDFNMLQEIEESFIPEQVKDVWKMLHDDPGFTLDPAKNIMADKMSRPVEGYPYTPQVRFDRMYLLPVGNEIQIQPTSIELFGDKPISEQEQEVFPSDHFGLLAEIDIKLK